MYDEEFFSKANLQSFVNHLFNDMPLKKMETDSPEKRYNEYMQGISAGLKSFYEAEVSDFQLSDYDHGPAATPVWINVWNLERLHFEMGFRTGAALFTEISNFQLGLLHNSQQKKGGTKKMDEMEHEKSVHRKIRGFSDSWYSAMKERINLQTIGTMFWHGSECTNIAHNSFEKRESRAYNELETYLKEKYGEEAATDILDEIDSYKIITDQIAFSLGMKAGATLQVKLLDNFETDV